MRAYRTILFYLLAIPISTLSLAQSAISSLPPAPPPFAHGAFWRWVWDLGGGAGTALPRTTVIAIALLSAFLTVVEVWQIPPATTSFSSPSPSKKGGGGESATGEAPAQSSKNNNSGKPASLLQSNFTTTVLSGLGGLAVVSLLDSLQPAQASGSAGGSGVKTYYIVLFVLFFSMFLFGSAILRGLGEALRSRLAIPYKIPIRGREGKQRSSGWSSYVFQRPWRWLLSYRPTFLVMMDTAFNVIQGKNQLQSAVFSEEIVELQRSLVRTVDQVRESIAAEILHAIKGREGAGEEHPNSEDVRVNISILSAGGSSVYYVSRDPKSLPRPFGRHSIAWLSVAAGLARWCKLDEEGVLSYEDKTELIKDRDKGLISDDPDSGQHLLANYFEYRPEPDYRAFIVIPVPWLARGEEGQYRKAGIQISFSRPGYMDEVWNGLDLEKSKKSEGEVKVASGKVVADKLKPDYDHWEHLLNLVPSNHGGAGKSRMIFIKDPGLHAALHQAVRVLEEALRHFNDTIFEEVIRPERQL